MRIVPPNPAAPDDDAVAGAGDSPPPDPPAVEAPTAAPPSTSHTNLVGTVLADRYRLLKRIGEGGMGTVFQAEHITIGRKLAVKVLASEYGDSPEIVARFLQEARTASMLHHEHIVDITDFGYTKQGLAFLTMEYLEGEDLATMLAREGRQPWTRVRRIMLQICRALDAAHEAGIVHRDMKPDNCFRIKRGGNPDFIKILDFGIAKVIVDLQNPSRAEKPKLATEAGTLLGTPEYMAPEIARDQQADARVDVYSIGVVMYELITGTVPFKGQTFMATVAMQMVDTPEPPHLRAPDAHIPDVIERVVLRALAKDPAERFQSIRALADAIIDADKTLRFTQSIPALVWDADDYAPEGQVDDSAALAPVGLEATLPATRASQSGMPPTSRSPEPQPEFAPAPVVDEEPSGFALRPNPYRFLAGLLLLVVAGLGTFVYYLLNRAPDPGEPLEEPTHIIAGAGAIAVAGGSGSGSDGEGDSEGEGDSDAAADTADDGKKATRPKKKAPRSDPAKKAAGLVASTDGERKEFFGALAGEVRRCADQHSAAKELVRVAVNVEASTGKLNAHLRSHKGNASFADCVVKSFEKRRFKRGKQAFTYNSDYQI